MIDDLARATALPQLMRIVDHTGEDYDPEYAIAIVVAWYDASVEPEVFAISTYGDSFRLGRGEYEYTLAPLEPR